MSYNEDYDRSDAADDAAAERRSEVEIDLINTDSIYAWKRRVVDAVHAKANGVRACHWKLGITDQTEVQKLLHSVEHLVKWLDEQLEEELAECADSESEARDPYGYRGLSRSDFH